MPHSHTGDNLKISTYDLMKTAESQHVNHCIGASGSEINHYNIRAGVLLTGGQFFFNSSKNV